MVVARACTAAEDERFPREARVRKRADFARAQRFGRRIALSHVVLLLARTGAVPRGEPVGAPTGARLGIVASRRVGNAVVRNLVKRRLREWFRRRRRELPAGIDLLVIVRPGGGTVGSLELWAELDAALGEIVRRSRKL
jgi:ribonuclease P protein component